MNLKESLAGKLTAKELAVFRGGFDIIGDIAIIEIPRELKKKQKMIAETLLSLLKQVKTVAVKQGGHKGKYRAQPLKVLAGEKRTTTQQIENGIKLALDVATCYYSPRLGTERMRLAQIVKKGEKILVAGGGIAPYALVLSKHSPAKHITTLEVNPHAHKYALHNIALNKADNITAVKGDLSKSKLGKYDRIIANVPHLGVNMTPHLLKFAKKGTTLHVYDFTPEEELNAPAKKLASLCAKAGKKCKIIGTRKVGQHAVRSYRVCVDARVL